MLKGMKKLREERILQQAARTVNYNDEGRAVINMVVNDDSSFLSPYSSNDQDVVSSDVADFIRINANGINPRADLCLNIKSDCISDENKEIYPKAIRNYFSAEAVENERSLARCVASAIVLAVAGLIMLTVKIILDIMINDIIWSSIMDCFSCVFLWESINQFFIERNLLRIKKLRLSGLSHIEVKYFNL